MKNDSKRSFYEKCKLLHFAKCFLVGAFFLFQLNVFAQQRAISGTVTGADNAPLPGVTVLLKGSTVGTTTGIDGKFSLTLPESAQTLVFSFMGMQTQEIAIGAGTVYNVTLSESLVGLD